MIELWHEVTFLLSAGQGFIAMSLISYSSPRSSATNSLHVPNRLVGNGLLDHFEKLRGNLAGFHSLRVNSQWRLVFRWDGSRGEAESVYLDDHGYR
jgi:toxin HigB-1